MNKNIVKLIAILVMCFVIGAVLVACEGPQGPQGEPGKDGAASTVPGPQGPAGNDGKDATLTVDADGYIWANGVNTGIKVDISEENEICDDEHQFVAETWKEHTISSKGIDIAFCVDCGYAEWQVVDHVYDVVKTTPATCTKNGKVEYFCECGLINEALTEVIDALGHDHPAFNPEKPTDGGWKYVDDSLNLVECKDQDVYSHTCARCGDVAKEMLPAPGCTWGEWRIAEDNKNLCPCLDDVVEARICSVCGDKETRVKEKATGHQNWGEWTEVVAPTLTTAGSAKRACTDCNHADCVETKVLPILNATDYVVATSGNACVGTVTTYTYTIGGKEFKYEDKVGGKGHTYVADATIANAPTFKAEGSVNLTCSECGHVETVTLPKLDKVNYTWTQGQCDAIPDKYTITKTVEGTEFTFTFEVASESNHAPYTGTEVTKEAEGTYYIYTLYMCSECGAWAKLDGTLKTEN